LTLLNGESEEAVAAVASISVKVGSIVDWGGRVAYEEAAPKAVPTPKRATAKVDNIADEDGC